MPDRMPDRRIPESELLAARPGVLAGWPTGSAVDLEEALAYQRAIPGEKRFASAMSAAREAGRLLIQPRAGVALIDDHIRLLHYLETEGEADLLPTTIDAYTRQNRYEEAEKGIARSVNAGASLLNGFPAVNHGVPGCRKVTESVSRPIQVRHGTPDARLLAEISLAGGFTSFEGGGISYNIPYAKSVPLARSIADWKYVDRLCGLYEERGVSINREPFGPLTGTLVPPCISHSVGILEGLLALEQGVRSLTLGYGQGGSLAQDVAALQSLRELAVEYFREAGHSDVDLTIVFHQWMGGFPEDEARAFSIICWGSAVACLGGADKVIVKTPHEAMGIPTREANAQGLRATRQTINMIADQPGLATREIEREKQVIAREVRSILSAALGLGRGDPAAAAVAGFEAGVIDVPFAPSSFNKGKILPMRDNEGCIRIFNRGAVPLDDETAGWHRERLQERARAEGRKVSFQMVTDDIYAVSKGRLVGRPR
jgi:methylaspartate mutase epsilon subunit